MQVITIYHSSEVYHSQLISCICRMGLDDTGTPPHIQNTFISSQVLVGCFSTPQQGSTSVTADFMKQRRDGVFLNASQR